MVMVFFSSPIHVTVHGPCRFGINCRRADCFFAHPAGWALNSTLDEPALTTSLRVGLSSLATSLLPQAPIFAQPTVCKLNYFCEFRIMTRNFIFSGLRAAVVGFISSSSLCM